MHLTAHTKHGALQGTLGKSAAPVASYRQELFPKVCKLELVTANKQNVYLISSTLLVEKKRQKQNKQCEVYDDGVS